MGICTRRHFLLSICLLQLISTVERQVFDFLGFMWIPILVNFFEIIFVIFGFFGTFQYRPKYVISYSVWNFILLAWNIFLICLFLDIGILNHEDNIVLKLDPGSASWWERNGPGCTVKLDPTAPDTIPGNVTGCYMDYEYVEVFHASIQCLFSLLGSLTGLCLIKTFLEEDDSFDFLDGNSKNPQHLALQPMYVSSTNLPLPKSSHPSNRRSVSSDHRNRISKSSDNYCSTDGSYADLSIDPHAPLKSFGHTPEMRRVSRVRNKPKINHVHVDQVRKFTQATGVQRTKSYDRLVPRNNHRKNEIIARPKSLYCNSFHD